MKKMAVKMSRVANGNKCASVHLVQCSGFEVEGLGFRIEGLGFRVYV